MAVSTGVELVARAYTVPTDEPESDGTLEWDSTTLVVVFARAEGETGLGYTYAPAAAAAVVDELLARRSPRSREPSTCCRARRCGRSSRSGSRTGGADPDRTVLRRLGLDVESPDSGCCGMAGAWGYEESH